MSTASPVSSAASDQSEKFSPSRPFSTSERTSQDIGAT
jgi:hypothetical protein